MLRQQFPRREVTATLGCAGLRRAELHAVRSVPGELLWGTEAVGNGVWAGVELARLLALAEPEEDAAHVEFVGGDEVRRDDRRFGFGGSIPFVKALSPEVLLAYDLNAAPLPPEHGFPVRAVVPGYYGARSVKWLSEVVVRAAPSANYFQSRAYRVQRTPDPDHPRDVSAGEPLGELALNSAIIAPQAGERLRPGEIPVLGWAIGRGAGPLARVEVSGDGGRTWIDAEFLGEERPWAWRLWRAVVRLLPGRHALVARAFGPRAAAQPERLEEVWNVKGYANNAWHRVAVEVVE
jgi:sulfite oxidase